MRLLELSSFFEALSSVVRFTGTPERWDKHTIVVLRLMESVNLNCTFFTDRHIIDYDSKSITTEYYFHRNSNFVSHSQFKHSNTYIVLSSFFETMVFFATSRAAHMSSGKQLECGSAVSQATFPIEFCSKKRQNESV